VAGGADLEINHDLYFLIAVVSTVAGGLTPR
jgi:hypothetical protein